MTIKTAKNRARYTVTNQVGRRFWTFAVRDNATGKVVRRHVTQGLAQQEAKALNKQWRDGVADMAA